MHLSSSTRDEFVELLGVPSLNNGSYKLSTVSAGLSYSHFIFIPVSPLFGKLRCYLRSLQSATVIYISTIPFTVYSASSRSKVFHFYYFLRLSTKFVLHPESALNLSSRHRVHRRPFVYAYSLHHFSPCRLHLPNAYGEFPGSKATLMGRILKNRETTGNVKTKNGKTTAIQASFPSDLHRRLLN